MITVLKNNRPVEKVKNHLFKALKSNALFRSKITFATGLIYKQHKS
ncbi:MAG: hypothetical protein FADNKDHG_01316 [Holosporales bacterium]